MMNLIPYIIFILTFGCVFLLVNQYFTYKEKQRFIRERFIPKQEEQGGKPSSLKPILKPLAPVNALLIKGKLREKTEERLLSAGAPLSVNEYFMFKELMVVFFPLILGLVIGWEKIAANPMLRLGVILSAGYGFIYPNLWLKAKINKRRKGILNALPSVIDLLILAVDAGLDFIIAVRRVVERSKGGPMIDELARMCQEVQVGVVRRDALKNLSKRVNIPEVHSFARTLIQAERMGTPMGEALRALSDEVRNRQFQRAEQQALKSPIKMLFPLLCCILPVVIILVGGPVFLQFFKAGVQFFK